MTRYSKLILVLLAACAVSTASFVAVAPGNAWRSVPITTGAGGRQGATVKQENTSRFYMSARANTNAFSGKKPSLAAGRPLVRKKILPKPVVLTHERDFFRQEARLNSMESYILVSTLTASMSFGCLVGFTPHATGPRTAKLLYKAICLAIQVVSGFSTIFGLYATIIFSLTILYGKSALGVERDREYDKFLRRTVRARVHGAQCFSHSLALFALEAMLVLVERTFLNPVCSIIMGCAAAIPLVYLYRDWNLLFENKDLIYE
jgi:hypothetical protein